VPGSPPTTVLDRYPPDCRPLSPPEPLGNAGGRSGARLWRLESGRGPLALRLWPVEGPGREALGRIHGWLAGLRDLGYVPLPIPDASGRTVVAEGGRLWQLEPWMPGAPDRSRPPRRARLRAGFAALGAVHERLARLGDVGPSPGLAARLAELEGLRRGGFGAIGDALSRAPAVPERELARRWLALAGPRAPGAEARLRRLADRPIPRQPCLRDVRADHVLFAGDRVTGLVDAGAMAPESPAADLARLLGDWVGAERPARAEALDAYGRPLDAATLELVGAFEASASLLIGGRWARWWLLEGRRFDDPDAVRLGLEAGVARLAGLAGSE
jgi:homoserine kinase type II